MEYQTLSLQRVSGALGARVEGVDLSQPLAAPQWEEFQAALREHHVLFLRDQSVGEERQLEFASGFGTVGVYPVLKLLGIDKPLETIEDSEESPPGADTWHTDVTWIECPPKVAMIVALDIPEYGGDTMWANMHAAYDALSGTMREMLDGLRCVHGLGEDFYSRVEAKAGAPLESHRSPL